MLPTAVTDPVMVLPPPLNTMLELEWMLPSVVEPPPVKREGLGVRSLEDGIAKGGTGTVRRHRPRLHGNKLYPNYPDRRAGNALTRAGITNFRWHDLRHTWASWHVQNGTPLHVLQELGGWSDYKMVQRYAHLAQEHLVRYVENSSHVTNMSQTTLRVL
jgi:hypothetical protein